MTSHASLTFLAIASFLGGCSQAPGTIGDGDQDGPPVHAEPPAPRALLPPGGTGTTTFAIRTLNLGDVDPDGTADKRNGWAHLGFDIDGRISTATSLDVCQPIDGASRNNVLPDGDDGIDNAFGKLILPIILGIEPSMSDHANASIDAGATTLLIDLEKLGEGSDEGPILGRVYGGAPTAAPPRWDGNDVWPVRADLLGNPADLSSAKVSFPGSYVVNDTWVGHANGDVPIVLMGKTITVHLTIHHAVITMALDPTRQSAARGVISGIISIADLIGEADAFGQTLGDGYCTNVLRASINEQLSQAADILADGTQDPGKPCEAISIGLGFEAQRVQLGPAAPGQEATPDPCP